MLLEKSGSSFWSPHFWAEYVRNNKRSVIKWTIGTILFLIIVSLIFYSFRFGWLQVVLEWIGSIGYWGNAMFIPLFCAISLPIILGGYSVLALSCGFLYGVPEGFATLCISALIGDIFGYWVMVLFGKKCLQIEKMERKHEWMKLINAALKDDAFKIMAMCRLTPIPYGLQNSIFALARVNFFKYLLAAFLCYIPPQFAMCYLGSTAKELSGIVGHKKPLSRPEIGLLVVEIFICICFLVFLAVIGKRIYRKVQQAGQSKLNEETDTENGQKIKMEDWDPSEEEGEEHPMQPLEEL